MSNVVYGVLVFSTQQKIGPFYDKKDADNFKKLCKKLGYSAQLRNLTSLNLDAPEYLETFSKPSDLIVEQQK